MNLRRLQVGDSESEGFWRAFIGSLKERGLQAHVPGLLLASHYEVRFTSIVKVPTRRIGVLPKGASITRSVGAVLFEQYEYWQLEGRRLFSADSMVAILWLNVSCS